MLKFSFVVWRVHLERMARLKKISETQAVDPVGDDNGGISQERTYVCASSPSVEKNVNTSVSLPPYTAGKQFPPAAYPPLDQIASSSAGPPTIPKPSSVYHPIISSKCVPRFYSVVWTGDDNKGVNGEYLLPDLDYPGRVLLSREGNTFEAWRKQIYQFDKDLVHTE